MCLTPGGHDDRGYRLREEQRESDMSEEMSSLRGVKGRACLAKAGDGWGEEGRDVEGELDVAHSRGQSAPDPTASDQRRLRLREEETRT